MREGERERGRGREGESNPGEAKEATSHDGGRDGSPQHSKDDDGANVLEKVPLSAPPEHVSLKFKIPRHDHSILPCAGSSQIQI